MTDPRPGWGLLATGGIARTFVQDLRVAGLRVAAVGSRTADRAQAFAAEFDVPHAHGDWLGLVEDPTVEVVYVATPHPQHAEAALLALEHGKHVLVEKPFTLNAAEAERVLTTARDRGLIALEGMWTRWLPHMLEIHAAIAAGAIGEPQALIADHQQSLPRDPAHRLNDPALGGGALLDLGVYPVSFAIDLFGEPASVEVAAALGGTGVDRRTSGVLVHPGGEHGVFVAASDARGPNRATITGTEGRIEIDAVWQVPTTWHLVDLHDRVLRSSRPEVPGTGMWLEAVEVERLIAAGETESPRMTSAGTLAVMRTLDRLRAGFGLVYPQESAG